MSELEKALFYGVIALVVWLVFGQVMKGLRSSTRDNYHPNGQRIIRGQVIR